MGKPFINIWTGLCCDVIMAFLRVILNIGAESVQTDDRVLTAVKLPGTWYRSRLFSGIQSTFFSLIHALITWMSSGISQQMSAFKMSFYHHDAAVWLFACWVRALRRSVTSLEVRSVYILTWPPVHSFRRSIVWVSNPMDPRCQRPCTHLSHAHLM